MNSISVVMATNRIDAYLDEAIVSVLTNKGITIELVLVLDGVNETSLGSQWIEDARIQVIKNKVSRGLGAALNMGVQAAKFDVIARLDADDIAEFDRFERQLEVLESKHKPVLVGTRSLLINDSGELLGTPAQPCGIDIRDKLFLQNIVPHSSYMFRKNDFNLSGQYDESLSQMEDYDLLLRLALKGPISMMCEPLLRYRVHSNQMSKSAHWRAKYVRNVMRRRYDLGKVLQKSTLEVTIKNVVWLAVQILRSAGTLRPRHLIGVRKIGNRQKRPPSK